MKKRGSVLSTDGRDAPVSLQSHPNRESYAPIHADSRELARQISGNANSQERFRFGAAEKARLHGQDLPDWLFTRLAFTQGLTGARRPNQPNQPCTPLGLCYQ